MAATAVTLCGIELENPIIPASGTFGYGQEFAQLYDINMLGTFSFKGTTRAPRFGNPTPRIAEYAGGMLNAVGLQNPGVDAFIAEELPFLRQFDTKVIANISGNTPEEYGIMCEKLSEAWVDLIEVNISCPNVHAGGRNFGSDPKAAAEVTRAVKAVTRKPVFMKLSPNVTDITEIARAVADAGADALSLINTLRGMRIDVNTRRPVLKMNTGGLSGPAVLPVAVRMVWEVACAVPHLPILGMGGVSKGEDAAQLMLAGACAGFVTAFLQTHLGVPSILAGIITNTGLYTVNLAIMGFSSNVPMLKTETVFTMARALFGEKSPYKLIVAVTVTVVACALLILFLGTRLGLSIRATGDNPDMVRASSINTAFTITVGLCVSNAMTSLSGAVLAQYQKSADINLGTGMVVIGLASLIIGETLFGRGGMWVKAAAAVAGSVIYRFIIALALRANVPSECLKLISAVIVALAIAAPALKKNLALRRRRAVSQKGGKTHA